MAHLVSGIPGMVALGVLVAVVVAEAVCVPGVFLPGATGVLAGSALVAAGRVPAAVGVPVLAAAVLAADLAAFATGRWLSAAAARHLAGSRWAGRLHAAGPKARTRQAAGRTGRLPLLARAAFPSLAGAAGLPYRQFLPAIVVLRLVWLPTLIGVGLLAGRALGTAQHLATPVLLVAGVVAFLLAAPGARTRVVRVASWRAGGALFLAWATVAALGAGGLIQDSVAHEELARIDPGVAHLIMAHAPTLVVAAGLGINHLMQFPGVVVMALLALALAGLIRPGRASPRFIVVLAGGIVLPLLADAALPAGSDGPPVTVGATVVAAVAVYGVGFATRAGRKGLAAVLTVIGLVGVAGCGAVQVLAGLPAVGIGAGMALGLSWAAVIEAVPRLIRGAPARRGGPLAGGA